MVHRRALQLLAAAAAAAVHAVPESSPAPTCASIAGVTLGLHHDLKDNYEAANQGECCSHCQANKASARRV